VVTVVSASDLLDVWEAAWHRTPLERGLAMLAVAEGTAPAALLGLPVGRRDRALFELRATLFGTVVDAVSACPRCGAEVELTFEHDELLADAGGAADEVTVTAGGRDHHVRLPTSADVAAVLDGDPGLAAAALVRRCAIAGTVGGPGTPALDTDAVAAAWSAADPAADLELVLRCPDCEQAWSETFDIVSYLWSELDVWCRRTLTEVHELASAYGWSEPEALALSPWRRQYYLGLVGA
jgi:hypothetical protein